jgi:hypothetical protein
MSEAIHRYMCEACACNVLNEFIAMETPGRPETSHEKIVQVAQPREGRSEGEAVRQRVHRPVKVLL